LQIDYILNPRSNILNSGVMCTTDCPND